LYYLVGSLKFVTTRRVFSPSSISDVIKDDDGSHPGGGAKSHREQRMTELLPEFRHRDCSEISLQSQSSGSTEPTKEGFSLL
jgi:hypothetical protein